MEKSKAQKLITEMVEMAPKKTFANIPFATQKALVSFLAIRGDTWSNLISERLWGLREWQDCDWLEVIEAVKREQGSEMFRLFEVPTTLLTEHIYQTCFDINSDYASWQEYHEWYLSSCSQPEESDTKGTPACIYSGDEEVLEDGWLYLHSYVASGRETIPLVLLFL
ncbi:hypothetical protein [Vibrio crassostreae]|uniref:hypothetical protein n=1 Tax=Vibrio crassostreae TaxID=246167 RepID=UPI001B301571|nr:hypothetical protein [Vibrio crassostreae]